MGEGFCFVNLFNANQYAKPTEAAGNPPMGIAKNDARKLLIRAIGIMVSQEDAVTTSLGMLCENRKTPPPTKDPRKTKRKMIKYIVGTET
jgi:hypothetical protein